MPDPRDSYRADDPAYHCRGCEHKWYRPKDGSLWCMCDTRSGQAFRVSPTGSCDEWEPNWRADDHG